MITFENFLNEEFDQKDEQRVVDIITKGGGKASGAALKLAETMANKITDKSKAIRRAEAAEELGAGAIAKIFRDRADELSGVKKDDKKEEVEKEEVEDKSTDEPKDEKPKPVKPIKTPKYKIGDYIIITREMISDGKKVEMSDGKSWRFITAAKLSGSPRILEVIAAKAGRHVSYGRGRNRRGEWESPIEAAARLDKSYIESLGEGEGVFFIKLIKVTGAWVMGKIIFPNGLDYNVDDTERKHLIRIKTADIVPNGKILDIILKDEQTVKDAVGKFKYEKRFFLGDEDFAFDKTGHKFDDITPGVYRSVALNFKLSESKDTPVVYLVPDSDPNMEGAKTFFCKLEDLKTLNKEIAVEQEIVVAEYLSKELDAEVTAKEDWRKNRVFEIPWFQITSPSTSKALSNYTESPFFSRTAAAKRLAELQHDTVRKPYDVTKLEVKEGATYSISFDKLMEYTKLVGIEMKMRQFFEKKRGQIASKSFGF